MALTPHQWHQRFTHQAGWTSSLRNYLYQQFSIQHASRILEIGCGTGAISAELSELCNACVFGVDIDPSFIQLAIRNTPDAWFSLADAHQIPFPADAFEITLCHFLLLWVDNPIRVLQELVRITQPGGAVAAMAEPDYGGRIDYPPELTILGDWQRDALRSQGADPFIGRRLRQMFQKAGLEKVESGVLGGLWSESPSMSELESEWKILHTDLSEHPEFIQRAQELQALDRSSREDGSRILYVPTFYAWGLVP